MKTKFALIALLSMAAVAAPASASDRKVMIKLETAMASDDVKKMGDSVAFYFGKQATPKVTKDHGSEKTSQKANAFGKSDEVACTRAFANAMIQLHKHAEKVGANAVVHIVSNYNNVESSSETEIECHAGGVMAGVALKGDFVNVAK